MKLSKNLGRIATTFLATAMLAGLTAVPASAAAAEIGTDGTVSNQTDISAITFTNALILPENVPMPSTELTFELKGITPATTTVTDVNSKSITVEGGKGTYTKTITFNTDNATKDTSYDVEKINRYTMDVTIELKELDEYLSFEQPGVYAYELSETTPAPSGDWTMADKLYVYLYVTRDLGTQVVKITGVSTSTDANNVTVGTTKQDTMTNYYQVTKPTDPGTDPTVKANKITISNTVDGAMGDRSDPYTFSVTINGADNKTYKAVYVDEHGDAIPSKADDAITLTSKITNPSITLNHGEYLQINGLSNGETFTVTENEAGQNNYSTSIKTNIDGKGTINSGVLSDEVFDGTKDITLDFTNTREAVAPTGLVMNVAPYVLLVLVAAGAGYVFLRKREED